MALAEQHPLGNDFDVELGLLTLDAPAAPDVDWLIDRADRLPYPVAIRLIDRWLGWFEQDVQPLLDQLPGSGLADDDFAKELCDRVVRLADLGKIRPELREAHYLLCDVACWLSVNRPRVQRRAVKRIGLAHEVRRMIDKAPGWRGEQFGDPRWWPDPPTVPTRPAVPRRPVRSRGDHGRRRRRPRRSRGPPAGEEDDESGADCVGRRRRGWAP